MHISEIDLPVSKNIKMGSTLEVLLVDDDEFDLSRIKRLVNKIDSNVSVTTCASAAEINLISKGKEFDICLLDLKLGSDSGLDIVNEFRNSPIHQNLPVVMVSGMQDTDDIVKTIKAGCANFLEKDHLTAEKLRRVIFEALTEGLPGSNLSNDLHAITDNIIQGIAQGCISELKPRLKKIYRQIGFVRDCHNHGYMPSPEALDSIEENCFAIWRFFDEIEAYGQSFSATKH